MQRYLYLLFFFILIFQIPCRAQKEGNIWYFGRNAGIDFNVNPPEPLSDGQINSREGVATISDKTTGTLLFYTEGTKVWDRNQQVMPNGDGLMGDYSSTQSAIIVPYPGNPGRYFVFTTAKSKGFRYSEIDMSLNNGMGDVVAGTKNTLLLSDSKSTEKVIATRHCNGKDYWVITHSLGDNAFYVYLITAGGVQPPQIYHLGSVIHDGGWEMTSYLKFSPDGRLLANAIGSPSASNLSSEVEFFHFNNKTGVLSGPSLILKPFIFPYGVEFSPDGNLVYISTLQGGSIFQYNLNVQDVASTRTQIASSSHLLFGALQLGSDGRIYVSAEDGYNRGYPYLGVINKPNVAGTGCGYVQDGFYLGGRATLIGLPTFMGSIFYHPEDFQTSHTCFGSTTQFKITNIKNIDSVQWTFGDGDSSQNINATHLYAQPGDYKVRLILYYSCRSDTVAKTITICTHKDQSIDAAICEGNTYQLPDGQKVSKAGDYTVQIKNDCGCDIKIVTHLKVNKSWHIVQRDSICPVASFRLPDGRTVNTAGTYISQFRTKEGCDSTIETQLFIKNQIVTQRDDTICTGESFSLPDGRVVNRPGDYQVKYNASNGCDSLVHYHLKVLPEPAVQLRKDFCVVPGEVVDLHPIFSGNATISWQDGSSRPDFKVSSPGVYWVKAGNKCGVAADTVHVTNNCLGRIFLPTAFTPNNDGRNDVFRILNVHGQQLIRFDIFNRWGKRVFHTTAMNKGWTGKNANAGSYVYLIKLRTLSNEVRIITGTVTLIR